MGGASAFIDHADAIGSTVMETDPSGAVVWDVVNGPWGQVWQQTGTRQSQVFAGMDWQVNDPLMPSATREYSDGLGRWMTPDPGNAGSDLGDSQSWNMYSYAGNNPVTNSDPSGLYCVQGSDGSWHDEGNGGETCAEAFSDKPGSVTVTTKAPEASYLTEPFVREALIIGQQFQTAGQLVTSAGRDAYSGFVNLLLNNQPSGALQLGLGIAGLASGGEGKEVEAIVESIAGGHALEEHIGEMVGLGVSDKAGLKALVQETIEMAGPADVRELERGRVAYYNEGKNVVVIYDPNHIDKGTVFRPRNGRSYFEGLH